MAVGNVGMTGAAMQAYNSQNSYSSKKADDTKKTGNAKQTKNAVMAEAANKAAGGGMVQKTADYGKTVGKPELSEAGKKYYDELKKKFGNMDFILVSKDQKENAKANAAKYANPAKMVVLIDEEKIERMATDEKYRKQYEAIIGNAQNNLANMKSQLASSGANVKGFGMQVNDDGSTSMFAVLKKSSSDQKARIQKKQAEKKAQQKAADKKEAKLEKEKRLEKSKAQKAEKADKSDQQKVDFDEDDYVTINANSIEELIQKIGDFTQNDKLNSIQTESEQMVGQSIDFKG